MKRTNAIFAALILPLCACQLTEPEPTVQPEASPTDSLPATTPSPQDQFRDFSVALQGFHAWQPYYDSILRDNGTKSSPTDTVDLIPSWIEIPQGVTVQWGYVNEMGIHTVDPSKPPRLPLNDGINLVVRSDASIYPLEISHTVESSLPAPEISLGSGRFDYPTDSIELESSRPGAIIRFSLDGSYPGASGELYRFDKKIPLDRALFLRTIAEIPGSGRSISSVAIYTVADGKTPGIAYDTILDARDGQRYPIVRLGDRTWMAKNLNWKASDSNPRSHLFGTKYATSQVLAVGTASICPEGWHPSTKADWDSLVAWGTRKPGVTPGNIANALRSNVLSRGPANPTSTQWPDSNFVDLFGFRGTSSGFATSTPGTVQGKTVSVQFDEKEILFPETPAIFDGYGIREDGTVGNLVMTSFQYVRCVKD